MGEPSFVGSHGLLQPHFKRGAVLQVTCVRVARVIGGKTTLQAGLAHDWCLPLRTQGLGHLDSCWSPRPPGAQRP